VLDCGDEKNGLKHAAKLRDQSGSRTLDLWTDAAILHLKNYIDGITGKVGAVYEKHAGACLETQRFPNAINEPNFPPVVVQPGEKYNHIMLFEFSA
jgi:aldose 1-epimerase